MADELPFRVEEWDAAEQHVVQLLAAAVNVVIARAAFQAAVAMRPGRRVLLRDGARVVERQEPSRKPGSEA